MAYTRRQRQRRRLEQKVVDSTEPTVFVDLLEEATAAFTVLKNVIFLACAEHNVGSTELDELQDGDWISESADFLLSYQLYNVRRCGDDRSSKHDYLYVDDVKAIVQLCRAVLKIGQHSPRIWTVL